MINTIVDNYLFTKFLGLDISQQKSNADTMYKNIKQAFASTIPTKLDYSGKSTITTQLYNRYNYLLFPLPGMIDLYKGIRQAFYEINPAGINEQWVIQCWLNFYKTGEFIDWHSHWESQYNAWHGFYCVDVEPDSGTMYKIPPNLDNIITVESVNDLLVLGKSDGDKHRSTEWNHDFPRITVAFDIITPEMLFAKHGNNIAPNHWVPLV